MTNGATPSRPRVRQLGLPPPDSWKNMPDLSAINHRRLAVALVRMVLGRLGVHAFPERSLWLNLIRLVDQSISDYQQARLYAKERDANAASFITNRSFMAMERMEQAILAACRASRFSSHRVAIKILPASLALSKADTDRLARIRHAIEHREERVLSGKGSGPFMLLMRRLDVQIQADKKTGRPAVLTYKTLSSILQKLDKASEYLGSIQNP